MDREEIIEKLRKQKGWLKKGAQWLADKWEVDIAIIKDCKKLVTSEEWVQERMNNDNGHELSESQAFTKHLLDNGLTMADVKSVKFWQNFNGEQRYSIVTHNQWHEQPQVKDELLDYIKNRSPKVPKIKYTKPKDPVLYEISLPDIHYGKITDEPFDAIEKHYMQAIVDLHRKADGLNIERFLLPVGNDGVDALKVKANNLKELQAVGSAIMKEGRPYKYIAIDTISKLEEWCEGYAKQIYMRTPMGKNFEKNNPGASVLSLPNGAGYLYLRMAYKEWIDKLNKLADHVILVGHLKDKMLEKKGKEVAVKDLDLTGKIKQITCTNSDAIGYIYREGKNTMISFDSLDDIAAGTRCAHLM